MKYKSLGITFLLAAIMGSAQAQNHFSATPQCPKVEPAQPVDVGDHPGHFMLLNKLSSCTFTKPFELNGLKSTSMTSIVAVDGTGPKFRDQGYVTTTMDNGDKAYARIQGAGTITDGGVPNEEGTWSFTGGTGKLKGIKGKGTYKITPEGIQIEGDYSLPEAGATAKK